jgi:hypothetical protein
MYKICNTQKNIKEIKEIVFEFTDKILSYENNFLELTYNYLEKFENEYYPKMKIEIKEKLLIYKIDILTELIDYLQNKQFDNKKIVLRTLNNMNLKEKIELKDKEIIIKNIENTELAEHFLDYIKNKYNIIPELEMLYGRYSSILHLIIISKTINKQFILNFNYSNNEIELSNDNKIVIYTPEKTKLTKYSEWIKQLILRYCYFNYMLKTEKTPKVLSIFLVDFPKQLYNTGITGPAEINTGVTNGIYINITRKEEALKTLIHELIHFHNMDFRSIPDNLNKLLLSKFPNIESEGYNMKLNLFEAYTECIASILNICLFYKYKKALNNRLNFSFYIKNHFINRFTEQIIYTFSKCYKLLNYFKCNIKKLEPGILKCKVNQKTNTVSYFFIKSYLYYYIVKFTLCLNLSSMEFNECSESFNKLYTIINLGSKNKNLEKLYMKCYTETNKSIKMVCISENI